MKYLLLLLLLSGHTVRSENESKFPNHTQVLCELYLHKPESMFAAAKELHSALIGHKFRLGIAATSAKLLNIFDLNPMHDLNYLTADFSETAEGYAMHLYDPNGDVHGGPIEFELPPISVWPVLDLNKQGLDRHYDDITIEFLSREGVPPGTFFGTILSVDRGERLFIAVISDEHGLAVHLGIDIDANAKIRSGSLPQRLLRTPDGWFRRTYILSFLEDTPKLRKLLAIDPLD